MRLSIEALAEASTNLDRRLDETGLRLDRDIDGARSTTRRLATEVGLMGEALVRRIEAGKPRPTAAKRRIGRIWPLALALTVIVMLAIAWFTVFRN